MPQVGQNPIREFMPQEFWSRWFDWFVYRVLYAPLAAGAVNVQGQFTIDNDSDYLVLSMSHVMTVVGAPQTEVTFVPVLISIQDTASGALWFDQEQHITNISGRGAFDGHGPALLETPRWVAAGSTVTVGATNQDVANARTLHMAFRGAKIYRSMRRNYPV